MYKVAFLLSIYTLTSFTAEKPPLSIAIEVWTTQKFFNSGQTSSPLPYPVKIALVPDMSFKDIATKIQEQCTIQEQCNITGELYWIDTGHPVTNDDAVIDDAHLNRLLSQQEQRCLFFIKNRWQGS